MSDTQYKWLKRIGILVWVFGFLMLAGPGMASKNPRSPDWMLAGILVQVAGFVLWLFCPVSPDK